MDGKASLNAKAQYMTTAPVEKLICRLAIPSITTMMITAIYNMADTYFVGQLGTSATGAVGVSFSLMAIIQAIGFLFGQGAGSLISREMGAGNFHIAARMATNSVASAFIAGLTITLLGIGFITPIALELGSTDTILPHAREYLFYILLAAPFMASSFTLNATLRYQGSAFYGMIAILCGAVTNIILDPIFIFVLDMGVGGAALATMCSQILGFSLLLAGTHRGGNLPIRPRNFSPNLSDYRRIIGIGFPSLCRQSVASLAAICLTRASGQFGDAAIAGMSIVQRVMMFSMAGILGWGQGFQPVCGFNFGARRFARLKRALWFCVKWASAMLTAMAVPGFVFAPDIIALFRADDPEVIRIGSLALRLQLLTFPFMGWVTISNMLMQATGLSGRATLMAVARQGLFLLPILFLLTPRLNMLGVQLAQPIADAATILLSAIVGRTVLRSMPNVDEINAPENETESPEDLLLESVDGL